MLLTLIHASKNCSGSFRKALIYNQRQCEIDLIAVEGTGSLEDAAPYKKPQV